MPKFVLVLKKTAKYLKTEAILSSLNQSTAVSRFFKLKQIEILQIQIKSKFVKLNFPPHLTNFIISLSFKLFVIRFGMS